MVNYPTGYREIGFRFCPIYLKYTRVASFFVT
jgi:hypothetical protein